MRLIDWYKKRRDKHEEQFRMEMGGSGVAHYKGVDDGNIGTLGCYCLGKDGKTYGLGCSHVMNNMNQGKEGDAIVRWSPLEGYEDQSRPIKTSLRIKGIYEEMPLALKASIKPEIGMRVIKSGLGTGVTKGEIVNVGVSVTIEEEGKTYPFVDQIEMKIEADEADSGAMVLDEKNLFPVGLLFSGNHDKRIAYANPLGRIEKEFPIAGYYCTIAPPKNASEDDWNIIATTTDAPIMYYMPEPGKIMYIWDYYRAIGLTK